MLKIIITGKNGYLSNSLKRYIENLSDNKIELLDLKNESWINQDFSSIDCIVHTSAIVHKNQKKYTLEEYRKINTYLTKSLAMKAKSEGVKQFVFISTMSVYGVEPSCFKKTIIDKNTVPLPKTKYGISKYEAEKELINMNSDDFIVTIIRPPIVYGKDCPGNYNLLRKLTLSIRIIPKINNMKSMIYIDNLCELVKQLIEKKIRGVFMPQNSDIVSTSKLSCSIAENNNKRVVEFAFIAPFVYAASLIVPQIKKAFGNEFYDLKLSDSIPVKYNIIDFEESVKLTEKYNI